MPASEAQKRANQKWQLKVYKYNSIKLHKEHDKDIIDWIEKTRDEGTTLNSYVKRLIREDMERSQQH